MMRFGCIAHSINLALMFILKRHVMIMDGFSLIKRMINHFNKSHQSKNELIIATGLSLLKFCGTRWGQWILAIERFLKIKDEVKKVILLLYF
jgi:hypothetical protein